MKNGKKIVVILLVGMLICHLSATGNCLLAENDNAIETDKSYVFDLNDLESDEIKEIYNLTDTELPEQFNLKDKMDIYVENQGTWDLCDLFANIKSIETNYALKTGISVDLSERYIDYMSSSLLFGQRELEGVNDGATMLYASKCGIPLESEITKEYYSDLSIITNATPVCRVVNTVDFKELNYTDETNGKLLRIIKNHIMKYGSLTVGICSPDESSAAYNSENYAYYYKDGIVDYELRPTHQVSIVGWDNSYSRDNFNITPENDGAFICLNSWGEEWGDNGYFYVSYDTISSFESMDGVLDTETCVRENEYTYAETSYLTGEIREATRSENCYGVVYDTKKEGEYLKHLAFCLTGNPGKIKAYCNPYDGEFDSSKYVYLGETTNSFWGITLMNWDKPIPLYGEQFALVFEIEYDAEMNDDFINNTTSMTRDTQEIISGHFYNSSSIDSGWELMDYDLQLYVYTIDGDMADQNGQDKDISDKNDINDKNEYNTDKEMNTSGQEINSDKNVKEDKEVIAEKNGKEQKESDSKKKSGTDSSKNTIVVVICIIAGGVLMTVTVIIIHKRKPGK